MLLMIANIAKGGISIVIGFLIEVATIQHLIVRGRFCSWFFYELIQFVVLLIAASWMQDLNSVLAGFTGVLTFFYV
jgi:hypothetical protein